jgi:hypothetical protein
MSSDISTWLKWAMERVDDKLSGADDNTRIHKDIYEFLIDRNEFLNNLNTSKADIKTSPRSWEAVSHTYRAWLANKTKYNLTENDLLNTISGDIGVIVAQEFVYFLENNKNPILKPAEILEGESLAKGEITVAIRDIVLNESILRKNVIIHNCLIYMVDGYTKLGDKKKPTKEFSTKEKLFIDLITDVIANNDLMFSMLLDLKSSKRLDDKKYLKHLLSLKDSRITNAFVKLTQGF